MRHFPMRELGYCVTFLVVMLTLYVGTYAALVRRALGTRPGSDGIGFQHEPVAIVPTYGTELAWVPKIFEPVHEIDRQVRKSYWSDSEFVGSEIEKAVRTIEKIRRDHDAASNMFR